MKMLLSEIGEHGFIRALRENFPMALAGDDGAVLPSLQTPVVTTDSFFEGTHFYRWWTAPEELAARLFEATLSDLAAMGAEPGYLFSSIMLPGDMELQWMLDFYRGLTGSGSCRMAGGETIRGNTFGVTLTAIGECSGSSPLLRKNARPGDSLWITGPVGRAFQAPQLLEKSLSEELTAMERNQTELFLKPKARFDTVPDLRRAGAEAAIDVSDGLLSECAHIAGESSVMVCLDLDKVPLVPYCRNNPVEACTAGEDFELLFTLPYGREIAGFSRIGRVCEGSGVTVRNHGENTELTPVGFDHFL